MTYQKKALQIWEKIPSNIRFKLLNNVWCSQCSATCSISEPHMSLVGGDLLMKGHCVTCGSDVARLVETTN